MLMYIFSFSDQYKMYMRVKRKKALTNIVCSNRIKMWI